MDSLENSYYKLFPQKYGGLVKELDHLVIIDDCFRVRESSNVIYYPFVFAGLPVKKVINQFKNCYLIDLIIKLLLIILVITKDFL